MTVTVNINNLSLVHRQSAGYSAATLPDVCKTPAGGDPVSYPNVARAADLAKGTATVTADGGNMCAKHGSEFSKSTGDEPGTMGGVKSGVNMKEATFITCSFSVKLEGKGACRLTDKMFHNHRNTVNISGEVQPSLPAPCSPEELKANLDRCDGGTDIWNKAKRAVGRDPGIEVGAASGGFGGHADLRNKKVVINPNPDCCAATQTLIFELTNLSNKSEFMRLHNEAEAGRLGREEYTKGHEKIEYEAVQNSYKSFDSCKDQWGCSQGSKARHDAHRTARDFDHWYDSYIKESHKNHYRTFWDRNFRARYEAAQAAAARPPRP
jgi:hypothetical protein